MVSPGHSLPVFTSFFLDYWRGMRRAISRFQKKQGQVNLPERHKEP
jgi:hypothetical protein